MDYTLGLEWRHGKSAESRSAVDNATANQLVEGLTAAVTDKSYAFI